MHIRKAKTGEGEAIVDLQVHTVRTVNSRDYSTGQIEAWLGHVRPEGVEARIHEGNVYVCVDRVGSILGFGIRVGSEIRGLYVSPEHQRKGVGSGLLRQMEEDASAEGIEELTATSTLTALDFYLKRGYEEVGREQWPSSGVEHALDAVGIRKLGSSQGITE